MMKKIFLQKGKIACRKVRQAIKHMQDFAARHAAKRYRYIGREIYRCCESGDGCRRTEDMTPMAINRDRMEEPP